MPRALWSGSLSFGLVNVPVALVSATRNLDVRFHQLHPETHERLSVQRVCTAEERPVPYDEIARGYATDEGYVMLTDEELEAVQPDKTRTIDIADFVALDEIDPVHFDHPYWLVPNADAEGALRAYRLLVDVMERSGRVAIGHVVIRTREHLVAIRPREGFLSLTTMLFADELRPDDDFPLPEADDEPGRRELDQAVALVEELSVDWDPERYPDRHRERLRALVERKAAGETVEVAAEPQAPEAVPDLMAALKQSLEAARGEQGARKARGARTGERKRPRSTTRS